jgi:hypothetical protein
MRVGGHRLECQGRRPQSLAADLFDEREHVIGFQRMRQHRGADVGCQIGQVQGQRQIAEIAQSLDEHHLLTRLQLQPARDCGRRRQMLYGPDLVADFAVVLERLLEADECVEAVVVLVHRDVRADLGSAIDESFVLQHRERLANGVAGHEEFLGQRTLGGHSAVVDTRVDLLAQHIGDLTRTVRAHSPDRRRLGLRHALTVWAGNAARTAREWPSAHVNRLRRHGPPPTRPLMVRGPPLRHPEPAQI